MLLRVATREFLISWKHDRSRLGVMPGRLLADLRGSRCGMCPIRAQINLPRSIVPLRDSSVRPPKGGAAARRPQPENSLQVQEGSRLPCTLAYLSPPCRIPQCAGLASTGAREGAGGADKYESSAQTRVKNVMKTVEMTARAADLPGRQGGGVSPRRACRGGRTLAGAHLGFACIAPGRGPVLLMQAPSKYQSIRSWR